MLGLFFLLLIAALGWATNEALARLAYRLEFMHRDVWNRLGQPVFLRRAPLIGNFAAQWRLQWFVLTGKFRQLRDAEIDRAVARALLLQAVTLTVLLLLLAAGAWARH